MRGSLRLAAATATLANQLKISNEEQTQVFIQFEELLAKTESDMRNLATRLESGSNEINASLRDLETSRSNARRSLSRALFLDEEETQGVMASNTIVRRRQSTRWQRYEEARRQAIQQAFLAKRAIEQRFAVRLAEMSDTMTLVEAPSSWEASLCVLDGMNLRRVADASDTAAEDFSDGYVGDYVSKLERFVDSYRLDYPFQNGQDTAVISLRDDVQNIREACASQRNQLLAYNNRLEILASEATRGWLPTDCTTDAEGNPGPNCIRVGIITDDARQPFESHVRLGSSPMAFEVQFGPNSAGCLDTDPTCECGVGVPCAWTMDATLAQPVALDPGRYRVSWIETAPSVPGNPTLADAPPVHVQASSSAGFVDLPLNVIDVPDPVDPNPYDSIPAGGDLDGWTRRYAVFEIGSATEARVAIAPPRTLDGQVVRNSIVHIAGLMLESLGTEVGSASRASYEQYLPPFVETDENAMVQIRRCEDADGSTFRAQSWTRRCELLCPSGFGGNCPASQATERCFWETQFSLNERAIERGEMLANAGFAVGNFNYRIESIGVNFVGTGSRTCADSELPSTCYSSGIIPYSLVHEGPFWVRNHFGKDYEAPLYAGVIEHADGLAAERYLTNPISSADMALMDSLTQRTFRGRPLAGNYTLRVWDAPGVNFSGVEDVQVVVDYRYWTRTF